MTAYVTRSPLQLLTNPHMMSDSRRPARRTSARLADKEDAPVVNGFVHAGEKGKGGQTNGAAIRHNKSGVNGTKGLALGGRGKRKLGVYPYRRSKLAGDVGGEWTADWVGYKAFKKKNEAY